MDPWILTAEEDGMKTLSAPRPGHADLAGGIKFDHKDMRSVLERASARSTAPRTLAGALAGRVLSELGVTVRSAVESIGGIFASLPETEEEWRHAAASDMGIARKEDASALKERITTAAAEGNSLGGTFVLSVTGLPAGIGTFTEWDGRLDGKLAQGILSVPGIKGVEFGLGFKSADHPGSLVHDGISVEEGRWTRKTNRCGGIEGGMTTGGDVLIRAAMKPIPTMKQGLPSYDTREGKTSVAHSERSDVCAVPAACVVAEAMTAWIVGAAVAEQFGSDRMKDLLERFRAYSREAERWNIHD